MTKKRRPVTIVFATRMYLLEMLRKNEIKRLDDMRVRLGASAKEHLPSGAAGFFFNGYEFVPESGVVVDRKQIRMLPFAFRTDAQLIIDQYKLLEEDLVTINQGIGILLLHAKTWQDMRDALYDGLAELHPTLAIMPRTRPEMYILPEGSKARDQYLEIRPLIEQYCAMRLIS